MNIRVNPRTTNICENFSSVQIRVNPWTKKSVNIRYNLWTIKIGGRLRVDRRCGGRGALFSSDILPRWGYFLIIGFHCRLRKSPRFNLYRLSGKSSRMEKWVQTFKGIKVHLFWFKVLPLIKKKYKMEVLSGNFIF